MLGNNRRGTDRAGRRVVSDQTAYRRARTRSGQWAAPAQSGFRFPRFAPHIPRAAASEAAPGVFLVSQTRHRRRRTQTTCSTRGRARRCDARSGLPVRPEDRAGQINFGIATTPGEIRRSHDPGRRPDRCAAHDGWGHGFGAGRRPTRPYSTVRRAPNPRQRPRSQEVHTCQAVARDAKGDFVDQIPGRASRNR